MEQQPIISLCTHLQEMNYLMLIHFCKGSADFPKKGCISKIMHAGGPWVKRSKQHLRFLELGCERGVCFQCDLLRIIIIHACMVCLLQPVKGCVSNIIIHSIFM